MFKILMYTEDLASGVYILKCSVPVNTQRDAIDVIKRPYSYMSVRTTRDYIDRLVVLDSDSDVIFGIDTDSKLYYNSINSLEYKTLHDYCETVIRQLLRYNYHEDIDNEIEW